MASLRELSAHHTEIEFNPAEANTIFLKRTNYLMHVNPNQLLCDENDGHFLLCKKIALEDINLDIELNDPELKPISKTEINNYIYYYNNGIRRTFNKESKMLLSTIPEFQL
jgi:hypothetical protein